MARAAMSNKLYCNWTGSGYDALAMEDLITFSFRVPRELAARVEAGARQLGLSRSEYARRALEQFQTLQMQQRIAELSRRVARQSAGAANSMEDSSFDGLA
jgi:predicted transcriptional regulator